MKILLIIAIVFLFFWMICRASAKREKGTLEMYEDEYGKIE
jgi:preprotein translocase subunit YajC